MKITEAIAAEHATLLRRFDEVERVLPRMGSRAEVCAMAAILEGLLEGCADLEVNLVFVPLDRALHYKGPLTRLAQDQQDISQRMQRVRRAATCAQARRLLLAALRASRAHFRNEERALLPALEKALTPELLVSLGESFNRSLGVLTERPEPLSLDSSSADNHVGASRSRRRWEAGAAAVTASKAGSKGSLRARLRL